MTIKESIIEMIDILNDALIDAKKHDKGNKAAGVRVRKYMQQIKAISQDVRNQISSGILITSEQRAALAPEYTKKMKYKSKWADGDIIESKTSPLRKALFWLCLGTTFWYVEMYEGYIEWVVNLIMIFFLGWCFLWAIDPPDIRSETKKRSIITTGRRTPKIIGTIIGGTIGGLVGGPLGIIAGVAIVNDPSVEWGESQNDDS